MHVCQALLSENEIAPNNVYITKICLYVFSDWTVAVCLVVGDENSAILTKYHGKQIKRHGTLSKHDGHK